VLQRPIKRQSGVQISPISNQNGSAHVELLNQKHQGMLYL
jgi:hypothetical protein